MAREESGQLVIVKDFTGALLVRRLVKVVDNLAYIVTDEGFKRLSTGGVVPVGFPMADVFEYDEAALRNPACLRKFSG